MNHKRLYLAAAIIAGVLVLGFLLSVPRVRDGEVVKETVENKTIPPVALRDTYKKGTHTITGTVTAPNACATLSTSATTTGDPAGAIVVEFTLTEGGGVCLQVPTPLKFSTTVASPEGLPISATVNGAVATTTAL
jgi:hypothetical protein